MDMDRDKMAERMLHLTLEILFRLTGEDYTVVKKTSSDRCQDPVSEGWGRPLSPITGPPPHPLIHEDINDQKILELFYKMIELLTGEVPIRCQDIAVYFSMEEWEYLEGHRDLYKDVIMEVPQPLTSPDLSSKRTTPERCSRPLLPQDCNQEDPSAPQDHQDYTVVKKTSSDRCQDPVSEGWGRPLSPITGPPPHPLIHEDINDQKILELFYKMIELLTGEVPIRCQDEDVAVYFSMEEWEYLEGHRDLYKDVIMEVPQPLTSPDLSSKRTTPDRCPRPLLPQDCNQEDPSAPQDHQGEDLTHINTTETYVRDDEWCKEKIPTYDYPGDVTPLGPSCESIWTAAAPPPVSRLSSPGIIRCCTEFCDCCCCRHGQVGAMPSCIVKGCTHYTGMKASNPLLTMHVFPRELSRIKLWLQEIGQNCGDLDNFATKVFAEARTGKYRICSAHFAPGSYTSQGSRIVLKPDAIPTLFPGIYSRPPPDWKPLSAQDKKSGTNSDNKDSSTVKAPTQKKEVTMDGTKRLQEGVRRSQGAKQGPAQERLLDVNGWKTSVSKESGHKDPKSKPDQLSCNWSLPIPANTNEENRRALWSLENVLVSLLQHLAEAPLTSRSQKQKTTRLLNQTAEIVSVLTGEEWTVVKKNSHISKFYNMIREVPIKVGDVAVFFSMDEWDYIEDHEEQYKHVMVEEPKSLQFNGSSDGTKCEFLPEPQSEQRSSFSELDFGDQLDYVQTPAAPPSHTDGTKCEFLPESQSEQRPSFSDLDFGDQLDYVQTPAAPPSRTDIEVAISCQDTDVLEMSCSSDDFIEQSSEPPQSERIDSSSGDKADEDRTDDPQSPLPSSPQPEKQKEIRKDGEDDDSDDNGGEDSDTSQKDADEETPDLPPDDVTAESVPEPPKDTEPPSADAMDESSSSELWIAQDGTTSSTWIPQDDPRPKGRNCFKYGKHAGRIQCPVSLSGTTILLPELPLKVESDPRCDLCDLTFPDKYELELHQRLMHSKKQRL
ncbi:uncharacterized protein [Dendrobates tinctorius]|uniref:uncharacterized protein n=1 Tax=Dendrobates tinctorius TaxID=92724 RepID=UPI003CC9DACD